MMDLLVVLAAVTLLVLVIVLYVLIARADVEIGYTKPALSPKVFHETMLRTSELFLTGDYDAICLALGDAATCSDARSLIGRGIMKELEGYMYVGSWLVHNYGVIYTDEETPRALRLLWLRESIRLGGIAHLHDIMRVHFPHMKRKSK